MSWLQILQITRHESVILITRQSYCLGCASPCYSMGRFTNTYQINRYHYESYPIFLCLIWLSIHVIQNKMVRLAESPIQLGYGRVITDRKRWDGLLIYESVDRLIIGPDNGRSSLSHFLKQCCHIVYQTSGNICQWKITWNSRKYNENIFQNSSNFVSAPMC